MNKYRLQIKDIEKYAREFWDDFKPKMEKDTTGSYINYMNNDTSELHNHICEPLIVANHWGNNCSIPKEDFTIQELDGNNVVKSYTYQEVWEILPKKKVNYKTESSGITKGNINKYLEPIIDVETRQVVCMTNFMNIIGMMHRDLFDDYLNGTFSEFVFDSPVYILDKANNKPAGVLNKYLDNEGF